MTIILNTVLLNEILLDCYIPPLDTMLYQQHRQGPAEPTERGNSWSRDNPPLLKKCRILKFIVGSFRLHSAVLTGGNILIDLGENLLINIGGP